MNGVKMTIDLDAVIGGCEYIEGNINPENGPASFMQFEVAKAARAYLFDLYRKNNPVLGADPTIGQGEGQAKSIGRTSGANPLTGTTVTDSARKQLLKIINTKIPNITLLSEKEIEVLKEALFNLPYEYKKGFIDGINAQEVTDDDAFDSMNDFRLQEIAVLESLLKEAHDAIRHAMQICNKWLDENYGRNGAMRDEAARYLKHIEETRDKLAERIKGNDD